MSSEYVTFGIGKQPGGTGGRVVDTGGGGVTVVVGSRNTGNPLR